MEIPLQGGESGKWANGPKYTIFPIRRKHILSPPARKIRGMSDEGLLTKGK
jgi:hypothetical protein